MRDERKGSLHLTGSPFFAVFATPELLFTGFTGRGEAFFHCSSSAASLPEELGANADGVRVCLGHPPAEGGNLAPHSVGEISTFTHELFLLLFIDLSLNKSIVWLWTGVK